MHAFGETEPWGEGTWDFRAYVTPAEVYIWRATFSNTEFTDPAQLASLVRAIGSQIVDFDIRGVTVDGNTVDVVLTARDYLPFPIFKLPFGWNTSDDITGFVLSNPDFRSRFPQSSISQSNLLQMTAPPQAIDFWHAHEILWDNKIGPKDGLAKLRGIYKGKADDGNNLIQWLKDKPSLVTNGSNTSTSPISSSGAAFWTIAVVSVAWLALRLYGSEATVGSDSTLRG